MRKLLLFFLAICMILPQPLNVEAESKKKEVILFIPGIMGTDLYYDEDREDLLWVNLTENFDDLSMDNELHPGAPLGWDGSKSFFALDFYEDIEEYFEDDYKVIYFGYDWRQSNKDTVEALEEKINEIIGDGDDIADDEDGDDIDDEGVSKVHIVAHSMGGIIAKKYILNTNGKTVDKFISVGTPYFGAPMAFDILLNGLYQWGVIPVVGSEIVQTIPSVYQLLPNTLYFNATKGYLGNLRSNGKINYFKYEVTKDYINDYFDKELFEEAEKYYANMYKDVGNILDGRFYRIIGDSNTTIGAIIEEQDRWGNIKFVTADTTGDGTVPLVGAAPARNKTWYVNTVHNELMGKVNKKYKERDVLEAIDDILAGNKVYLRTKAKGNTDIKLSVYNASVRGSTVLTKTESTNEDPTFSLNLLDTTKRLEPTISITFSDGSIFKMDQGKTTVENEKVTIRKLGSTIEYIFPQEPVDFSIEKTNSNNDEVGIIVSRNDDGVNTERLEYRELVANGQNKIVANISSDFNILLGQDLDFDGKVDTPVTPVELDTLNLDPNIYYYDEVSPYEPINDDDEDGDNSGDDPGDGSVSIEVTGEEGNNSWKTSDVTIGINTSIKLPDENDANGAETTLDPEISYKVDDEPETNYSGPINYGRDGKHLITAYAKDKDGNILGQASKIFKIDQTNPEVQTQVAGVRGENGWIVSNAQVSIGASDETSKLARVDVDLDGLGYTTYGAPIDVKEEGSHTVGAEAEDNAGNIETDSASFKIDKTKPVISNVFLQDEYYWDQDFPIQFNVSDAVSGVASVKATINEKPVTNGSMYHFTEPGWHTYRIEVKDEAGWKAVYETKFEVYIPAKITFNPENLQLDHGSGMATNHIELPEPFEPERINFSTIQTNKKVVHVQDPQYGYVKNPITDFNDDGIRDMMLKYQRESLVDVIAPKETGSKWSDGDITMFGEWDSYHFKGYDHIQVLNSGYTPPPSDVTPPTASFVPNDGENNVSVDVTPNITFSEPVILKSGEELSDDAALGIVEFKESSGQLIPFTANWMKNSLSLQINPTMQLEGLGTYTLTVKPETVTDMVYNTNQSLTVSFNTENHPIVIESPLPIPEIEEDDDSGYPNPEPVPTPAPTPVPTPAPAPSPIPPSSGTPTQQIVEFNQQASSAILSAEDSETIAHEVEDAVDRINNFTDSKDQSIMAKLDAIDNTVDTVMTAVVEKLNERTIKQSDVKKYVQMLLEDNLDNVIGSIEANQDEEIDQAVKVLSNFEKKVFSHIDELDDLSDGIADVINDALSKENTVSAKNNSEISDIHETINRLAAHINTLEDSLAGHATKVGLEKQIQINVETNTDAKLKIMTDVLHNLQENQLQLAIMTESRTGVVIPPELYKKMNDSGLEVSIAKVGKGKKSTLSITSDEYEFVLRSGEEKITQFGDEEVTVSIPLKNKMYHPQAFYYEEKKKKWVPVKSNKGNVVDVVKKDGTATFNTPHFTKFKLSDAPVSKITVKPSRTQIEPGAELQLAVTASVNKKNVDVTSAEKGTTYESSLPDVITVDENGLLKATEDAKEGKRVIITVKNSGKTSKVYLTVAYKKITSITVTPKKVSLQPGASEHLTVTARMSDRSTKNVTGSELGTTYKSSNEDVAMVDENGVVTISEGAKKGQKVTITATQSGKTSKCYLTVE